jgi:hypothetical protein
MIETIFERTGSSWKKYISSKFQIHLHTKTKPTTITRLRIKCLSHLRESPANLWLMRCMLIN